MNCRHKYLRDEASTFRMGDKDCEVLVCIWCGNWVPGDVIKPDKKEDTCNQET